MAAARCFDLENEKEYMHGLLVNKLHDAIDEDKTKKIRQLLLSVLKKNLDAADMITMLNDLTYKGIIKVGEYSYLKRLLKDVGLQVLVDTVEKSEKEIQCLMDNNVVAEDEDTVQEESQENGERPKRKRTLDTSCERCAELKLKLELQKTERDTRANEFVLQIANRALTDDVLKNPKKRKSIYSELLQFKAELVGPIRTGSVLLTVRFYSLADLTYFWSKYMDGTVTAALSKTLLSDKIFEISRENHVEFYITCDISEDSYIEACRKLSSEDEVPSTMDAMARLSISDDTKGQEAMRGVVSEAKERKAEASGADFVEETATYTPRSSEHKQDRPLRNVERFQSSNRRPRRSVENKEDMDNLSKYLADLLHQEKNFTYFLCENLEQLFKILIRDFALKIHPGRADMLSFLQLKVLGGFVDGLAIPYLLHREDKRSTIPVNVDIMVVLSPPYFPPVTARRETEKTTEEALVVDGQGCHPGYVKLKLQGQYRFFALPDIVERDRGNIYLSNRCVRHCFQNVNSGLFQKVLDVLRVRIHPEMPYSMSPSFHDKDYHCLVGYYLASIPWEKFPHEADGWLCRNRGSGWPNPEQIKAVKELGCHLVPVAYPGDQDSRTDWRITFALAERHLALSLNQVQRHVFRIIKLIHKHRLGHLGLLSSYHLKTTLFWLCERIPQDRWTNEEMGQRVYDFLDLLLDFLQNRCIPDYFIPENNLIDYQDEGIVKYIMDIFQAIRHNPKAILTEIQAMYEICFDLSQPTCILRLFQNMFAAIEEAGVNSSSVIRKFAGEKEITKLFAEGELRFAIAVLLHAAVKDGITEKMGDDFTVDTLTDVFKQLVDDALASAEEHPLVDLLGKVNGLLKLLDQQMQLTHAKDKESRARKIVLSPRRK